MDAEKIATTVHKRYRYRIYPTEEQQDFMRQNCGAARYVYNRFVEMGNDDMKAGRKVKKHGYPELFADAPWLKEMDACALDSAKRDYYTALNCYFEDPKTGKPKKKTKKNSRKSYRTNKQKNSNTIWVKKNKLKLPKIKQPIKIIKHRYLPEGCCITSATIIEETRGVYHEVIHCAPGCFNHGKPFKALSAKVNAKYGTNVETSKKADAPSNSSRFASSIAAPLPPLSSEKSDPRALVAAHIGESFKRGRKTYTFTGFNENPKNCCDLMDSAGNKYKAPAELVAEELGVVSDAAKLEQRRRAAAKRMADVELRNALNKKIGKSFCDGRKTYTFIGFNSNPKNCCNLVDERGIPYKCALATLAHDFGIA